jgi:hypothetical protein
MYTYNYRRKATTLMLRYLMHMTFKKKKKGQKKI